MWICFGCGNCGLIFFLIWGCGLLLFVRLKIGAVMVAAVFVVSVVFFMLDVSGEIAAAVFIGGIAVIEGVFSEDLIGFGFLIGFGIGWY